MGNRIKKIKKIRIHREGTDTLLYGLMGIIAVAIVLWQSFDNKIPFWLFVAVFGTVYAIVLNFYRCPIRYYGSEDTENFTSTDKLYLLAPGEVWSDWKTISDAQYDTTKNLTRTLDYYTAQGVTTSNYSGAIKKNGTNAYIWCLRTPHSITYNSFFVVNYTGGWTLYSAHDTNGVSPAFRIG